MCKSVRYSIARLPEINVVTSDIRARGFYGPVLVWWCEFTRIRTAAMYVFLGSRVLMSRVYFRVRCENVIFPPFDATAVALQNSIKRIYINYAGWFLIRARPHVLTVKIPKRGFLSSQVTVKPVFSCQLDGVVLRVCTNFVFFSNGTSI